MKALVIASHPDDEVLGCGGVIARHRDKGHEVHVVIVTKGSPDLYTEEQVTKVYKEMANAHEVLGGTQTYFLDFPAPCLDTVPAYKIADAIRAVLLDVKPDYVYIPHGGDIHLDHRITYLASLVATRPFKPWAPRKIFCYETPSETDWAPPKPHEAFIPNVFVDIGPQLERKLQAMACFEGQVQPEPHARSLVALKALAQLRGNTVSMPAAEAFMLIRELEG